MTTNEPDRTDQAAVRCWPLFRVRRARAVCSCSWSAVCVAVALLSVGAGCGAGNSVTAVAKADGGGPDGARPVLVRGTTMLDGAVPDAAADSTVILGTTDGSDDTGGGPNKGGDGGDAASTSDGGIDGAGDVVPTATGCVPPVESTVCDPVCDTGCGPLSRCDVTDAPRTGSCVAVWVTGEGALCVRTALTDPCAAHLTCVDGACRRLCYRDSDCASPGTCCGQDLLLQGHSSGYKLCVPCPR
ncbi:MAG: hypothetical protein ABJA82_14790 [Myxococcales bacterium]